MAFVCGRLGSIVLGSYWVNLRVVVCACVLCFPSSRRGGVPVVYHELSAVVAVSPCAGNRWWCAAVAAFLELYFALLCFSVCFVLKYHFFFRNL
jgi:hypothetical protein